MTALLLGFLPDNALPVLLVFAGIGLMIGLVSRRVVAGFVGSIVLFALLSPFIDSIMNSLPLWLLIALMGFFVLTLVRMVFGTLFGKGATGVFMGHLLWGIFTLPFRVVAFLFGARRR